MDPRAGRSPRHGGGAFDLWWRCFARRCPPVPHISGLRSALGSARVHGDRAAFTRLLATTVLYGAPVEADGRLEFVTGGPLGNAILWAMLTAAPHREAAR